MMSVEEMAALESASGRDFDRMFLEMMTAHHRGAIEMARTEIEDGKYEPATSLADAIVEAQTSEIDEMETITASLG
jgi:uncharacterized protein (DUF305 family)